MMNIPFLELDKGYFELKEEIDHAVAKVLSSGKYILGEEVAQFELEFANYCSSADAIGVGNGFDALLISLMALEIGPGDEVIVPTNTFIATWLAVSHCGARPVPVEIDALTQHIDINRIQAAITSKTRAIIPVHLFGNPVDLQPLQELARSRKLMVIEDAAQAHGARYRGARIGAHSDLVCWSFYPGKNLGAFGDAGAITTNNQLLAKRIRKLRNYGASEKYHHEYQGVNSRMDELQAAILRIKLNRLDEWNQRRQNIAKIYTAALEGSPLTLPKIKNYAEPTWHLFVIRHHQRDELSQLLSQSGIETVIHYPTPPAAQPAYREYFPDLCADSPARLCANENLSLPIGPHLLPETAHYVAAKVNMALKKLGKSHETNFI
jgi:dTDP-4-amino-4,6-dideoxygalactose transaminase